MTILIVGGDELKYPSRNPYLTYKRTGNDEYRVKNYLYSEFVALIVSYVLVGFQIVMPLMMVYEGYSLMKLILL